MRVKKRGNKNQNLEAERLQERAEQSASHNRGKISRGANHNLEQRIGTAKRKQ
jgi:hypothetical protein